jgi:dTDP-4-dehydrorhamnose 3,5-epimerase
VLFQPTDLPGVVLVRLQPARDDRGFFARSFCAREFVEHGLPATFVQCNVSYNARAGTLRGLHFQAEPSAEGKLVRCTAGAIFDVVVDVRAASKTRGHWLGFELDAQNRDALYIPPGFAHGFLTLADHSEVFYEMTEFFDPAAAQGCRWDDPRIAIRWPRSVVVVSERDRAYPDFSG